ncbi:MAG: 16S rRNA (guanine(527)-N(7))-methyltransferase RsmG [Candidatus Obscuribacterales bacterium]|jgi:16S rRNA (guanine527-N7)-methyltransferase|nr:16S rRNA (guanine(527)-N(7))-methyltransferase RsmG [Candidatus Obscuribacterales bacterium]
MTNGLLDGLLDAEDAAAILSAMDQHELNDDSKKQILLFCDELRAYNEHTNLVANANLDVVLKEHVLDSLTLLPSIKKDSDAKLIDIGSGAGFPGLILAIARPQLKVFLLESIGKKCRFLEKACEKLGLGSKRVHVVCDRAEVLGHSPEYRERFTYATARAVAALPIVAELTLPFLKVGGIFLAQRSKRQVEQEQADAEAYISRLGGRVLRTDLLPEDLIGRQLSVTSIEKDRTTPRRFPRPAAQIQKDKKAGRV